MTKLTVNNNSGYPDGILDLKRTYDNLLWIYELLVRICWELSVIVWKLDWSSRQQIKIKWNHFTYLYHVLLQNKQEPIRSSCRSNLWLSP